jgi:Flp pilus assembly protein TadB
MSKKLSRASAAAQTAHPTSSIEAKAAAELEEWRRSQQMLRDRYGIQVRHPAFPTLALFAVVLLVISWFSNNLWLALIAGIIAVSLSLWNRRAAEAKHSAEKTLDGSSSAG